MSIHINLINNIAFLVALVAAGQMLLSHFQRSEKRRQLALGLLFGCVTLLGMLNPVTVAPGIFFDGRSIVLSVAGVVGGGVAAAVAASIAAIYRLHLGGGGALVGVIVVIQSALIGVIARQWWQQRGAPPHAISYLALGVVVQIAQAGAFTLLPNRAGYAFIEQAWWVLAFFYPLATMLLCLIFRNYEQQLLGKDELRQAKEAFAAEERASMKRFHAYFDHSIIGVGIIGRDAFWVEVNDALSAMLGYTREELRRRSWTDICRTESRAPEHDQFDRVLAGEISNYKSETRFVHKAGHLIDVRVAMGAVRKSDGSLDYAVVTVDDITERKRAEEELRTQSQRLSLAASSAALGVWDLDIRTNVLSWDDRMYELYGIARGDGSSNLDTWVNGLHPDDKDAAIAEYQSAVSGDGTFDTAFRILQPNGAVRHLKANAVVIRDADGTPIRMLGINADITDRKLSEEALQRSEAELREAQRIAHLGFWRLELATNKVTWSQELYAMFGFDLSSSPPAFPEHQQLFAPDSWKRLSSVMSRTLKSGEPFEQELEVRRANGTSGWIWVRGEPIFDRASRAAVALQGVAQDISDRKATEIELERYRRNLELEVSKRTRDFERAKDAAEAASRAKSAFLATMSHELRTPMTAIMGMTQLALLRATDPKQKVELGKVMNASEHLLSLISNVLDISRIEADRLVLEQVDFALDEILGNLQSMLGPQAAEKGLEFRSELQPGLSQRSFSGDPTRLGQILVNLVGNAIKFTKDGTVSVRASVVKDTSKKVLLRWEVADTGIGMDEEVQKRLFLAFEQADNSITRKYGGSGLGLAISKRLVQMMDGEIGVTSVPGQGTTFWFTVWVDTTEPVARAAGISHDSLRSADQIRLLVGRRALAVDDSEDNRRVAAGFFEQLGIQADVVSGGEAALKLALAKTYDIIFIDLRMPEMDGFQVVRKLREYPTTGHTPLIALSGDVSDTARCECMNAGFDDFLAKPYTLNGLIAVLQTWLDSKLSLRTSRDTSSSASKSLPFGQKSH